MWEGRARLHYTEIVCWSPCVISLSQCTCSWRDSFPFKMLKFLQLYQKRVKSSFQSEACLPALNHCWKFFDWSSNELGLVCICALEAHECWRLCVGWRKFMIIGSQIKTTVNQEKFHSTSSYFHFTSRYCICQIGLQQIGLQQNLPTFCMILKYLRLWKCFEKCKVRCK